MFYQHPSERKFHVGGHHPLVFDQPLAGTQLARLERSIGTVAIFTRAFLLVAMLSLAAALVVSCRTDRASLERYQAQYRVATNAVEQVHHAVQPYVPAPFNAASETLFGIVSAALAAWNAWQHKQIRALKNGNGNGNGNGNAKVSAPAGGKA